MARSGSVLGVILAILSRFNGSMERGDGTEDVAGRVSPGVSSEIQQKYGMGLGSGAAGIFDCITRL